MIWVRIRLELWLKQLIMKEYESNSFPVRHTQHIFIYAYMASDI